MNEVLTTDVPTQADIESANGSVPEGYTVLKAGELNGQKYLVAQSPDGNITKKIDLPAEAAQPPLTSEQQAIQAQRDQWETNFPGKSYLTPEGPTLGPNDISRLEAEAEAYGLANYKRTEVAELYQSVMQTGSERESTLRAKIEAEFPARDPNEITALIQKKKDQAMEAKRQEIIDQRLPYPQDARRRDIKKIDKQREQLASILTKSPDEFAQLNTDWQGYEDIIHTDEIASLQIEANEADKSLRSNTEKARLRERLDELDQQNGGALEYLSQYELEKDQPTATIIQDYKNRLVKHKDDEDLQDFDRMFAFRDLKLRLTEVISSSSPSLTDAEVSQRTEAATSQLEDWVDSMTENETDPLKDLAEYKNQQRAYENWDRRRRQAVEHLAPVVLARLIQRRFLEVAEKATEIPVAGKIIDRIFDSRKIGANNGAHMLRRGDQLSGTSASIYRAGVMGQLELGRHSGYLLKTALVLDSLARSGVDQISPVIDRLPDAERRKLIRKKMYGKAAVLAALSRRSAKKAADRLKAEAKFVGQQFNIIEEDRWNAGR